MAHKVFLLVVIILFSSFQGAGAQEREEYDIIASYLEPPFMTFGGGINFGGDGQWSDHFFEVEINHHLHWWSNPLWPGNKATGLMMVNPKIQLRMLNEISAPVKTPGFLPRATYFFWLDRHFKSKVRFSYFSIMLSHHSNGQAGDFYNPDGTVNTDSGSFSTNFLEFSFYNISDWGLFPNWKKVSFEWHPGFNREDNLKDQYESAKIRLSSQAKGALLPSKIREPREWLYKLLVEASYIVRGREYVVAPNADFPGIEPEKASTWDNVAFSAEASIKPHFFDQISFFFKYDYGSDYYNIHFQEHISRFQFGFSGTT